jgi:hypothetical protein
MLVGMQLQMLVACDGFVGLLTDLYCKVECFHASCPLTPRGLGALPPSFHSPHLLSGAKR